MTGRPYKKHRKDDRDKTDCLADRPYQSDKYEKHVTNPQWATRLLALHPPILREPTPLEEIRVSFQHACKVA